MYNKLTIFFFELLQIAIGQGKALSTTPNETQWQELYMFAKKQALIGILFKGIEIIPIVQRPPKSLLLKWGITTNQIKNINLELDKKISKLSEQFQKAGFKSIVLKGRSFTHYYKVDELDKYRTPGDIDVWLDGRRDDIINYVSSIMPNSKILYHHIDFPKVDGIDVEVHFTPSWMNSFFTNRKLQSYFIKNKNSLFNKINTKNVIFPNLSFNRIYVLVHIYRHLFGTGIGLKQLLDYYYILKQGFCEEERIETMRILTSFKMKKFTGAVMWVLQKVFYMDEMYLLTEPNEKEGKFLLYEILHSGNFGQYDNRMLRTKNDSDLSWGIKKLKRNFRFITNYPSEVLWSPFFKIWHFMWRKKMNLIRENKFK